MIQKLTITILIIGLGYSPVVISFNDRTHGVPQRLDPIGSSNGAKRADIDQPQHPFEQRVKRIDRLLPRDARIVLFDPDGDGNQEEAILTAHLKNHFQQQTVVLYRKSMVESGGSLQSMNPLTLVIFSNYQGQLYKEWETKLAGPRVWVQEGKDIGLQIVDVNADGKDEIMTITGIGASLGAHLQIFAWNGKSYQQINPPIDGHYFQFDRDGRGNLRIRAKSRYEEVFHIYEWDGRQYREVNAKSYPKREAEFYENMLLGSEPLTPYLFEDYLQRVVWSYRRNGEIDRAIDLCEQALQVIDMPGKLIPVMPSDEANLTLQQLEAIQENFEVSRRSIPASLHMLLGELNEQMGHLNEALQHYGRALQLDPSNQLLSDRIKAIEHRLRSLLR